MKINTSDFKIIIRSDAPAGFVFKDFWQYRHLFYFLAWRDILVRYGRLDELRKKSIKYLQNALDPKDKGK